MENLFEDKPLIDSDELREESESSEILYQVMLSSAASKNVPRWECFKKQLIELPLEERVFFAFDFFESIDGLPKVQSKSQKSSEEALKWKKSGNDAYIRGEFIEALKLYTKSLATAPAGSQDLALAYANRSAALLALDRYDACLVDINRALKENYPDALKTKLYKRKQKCRSKMIARNVCEFDQKCMEKLTLRDNGCETKKDSLIDEDALDLDYGQKFPLPKTNLKNESIPGASEKIKIMVNSTFGRHIVAVKDIEIGEYIGIEKPYAAVLSKIHQYSHCGKCFLRCESLIPCPSCSEVMYCSQLCREDAFNQHHRIECQIRSFTQDLPLSKALWLVIRTLMVISKQGEELENLMVDPLFKNPMKKARDQVPEKFHSRDNVHLLNMMNSLVSGEPSPQLSDELFTEFSMYLVHTVGHILRQTTYFDKSTVKKIQELPGKAKYVGLLFLKLMMSLPLYTVGIHEMVQKNVNNISQQLFNCKPIRMVGIGMYLFHSLFSHSCYMNVTGSYYKDNLVTQAIQPIKAGQQLFISYGPNFLTDPRTQRQKHLRMVYKFECRCEACKHDWPDFFSMSTDLVPLPNRDISEWQLMRYELEKKFSDNSSCLIEHSPELFDFFREYLTIFYENCKKPCQDYFLCYLAFQALLQSRGNNYVYIRDNVLMSL